MRPIIPLLCAGVAGIAVTAALTLPAAAADQSTAATPHKDIVTLPSASVVQVRPGDAIEIVGACRVIDNGRPALHADFLAGALRYAVVPCQDGVNIHPDWTDTVSKTARDGIYSVSYNWTGTTYTAKVEVVGGKPPVAKPAKPRPAGTAGAGEAEGGAAGR